MRNKINDESLRSPTKEKTLLQEIDEVSETKRYPLGTGQTVQVHELYKC